MDPSGRPARMVPVVLPISHGAAGPRRRPADPEMESDGTPCRPGTKALRSRRPRVPAEAETGSSALGVRQPDALAFGQPLEFAPCANGYAVATPPESAALRGRPSR